MSAGLLQHRSKGRGAAALEAARATSAAGKALETPQTLRKPTREEVLRQYHGFCLQIVNDLMRQFGLRHDLRDDMMAEAQIGLMDAMDRFEGQHGATFSTYAYYRVRGAVVDGLRQAGVLRRKTRLQAALMIAQAALEEDDPTKTVQGAEEATKYVEQRVAQLGAVWLVAQSNEDEQGQTEEQDGAEAQVLDRELRGTVRKCLSMLPDAEREVLQAIYFEGKVLQEIVQGRDVSRSWACRLHARALQRFQKLWEELGPELS